MVCKHCGIEIIKEDSSFFHRRGQRSGITWERCLNAKADEYVAGSGNVAEPCTKELNISKLLKIIDGEK